MGYDATDGKGKYPFWAVARTPIKGTYPFNLATDTGPAGADLHPRAAGCQGLALPAPAAATKDQPHRGTLEKKRFWFGLTQKVVSSRGFLWVE